MARAPYSTRLTPSVLDRLLDDEPKLLYEPVEKQAQSVRDLEKSVARDLEALLNTRQESLGEIPEEFIEVNDSLLIYGLPDFTAFSLMNRHDRTRILRGVERAVAKFEPRLQRVRVAIEASRENERGLRFRIDALLRLEPTPEPVSFDAILELNTQQYVVQNQN